MALRAARLTAALATLAEASAELTTFLRLAALLRVARFHMGGMGALVPTVGVARGGVGVRLADVRFVVTVDIGDSSEGSCDVAVGADGTGQGQLYTSSPAPSSNAWLALSVDLFLSEEALVMQGFEPQV